MDNTSIHRTVVLTLYGLIAGLVLRTYFCTERVPIPVAGTAAQGQAQLVAPTDPATAQAEPTPAGSPPAEKYAVVCLISAEHLWRVMLLAMVFLLSWLRFGYDSPEHFPVPVLEMFLRITAVILIGIAALYVINDDLTFAVYAGCFGVIETILSHVKVRPVEQQGGQSGRTGPVVCARVLSALSHFSFGIAVCLLMSGVVYRYVPPNIQSGLGHFGSGVLAAYCLLTLGLLASATLLRHWLRGQSPPGAGQASQPSPTHSPSTSPDGNGQAAILPPAAGVPALALPKA